MFDYHMHSKYSCDAREEIDTLCRHAIKRGLTEIAITDHFDLYQDNSRLDNIDFDFLFLDIVNAQAKYCNKLKIKFGVELGQAHVNMSAVEELLSSHPFDFVIGSVHNLDDASDLAFVDYSSLSFDAVFDDYLEELIKMVSLTDFDVVGHMNYPVRYAFAKTKVYPDWAKFKPKIEYLFKEVIRRDKGIELNCSGFVQALQRPMPDFELLSFYKQ